MLPAVLSLANSPLVWFALLLVSLTAAGVLLSLATRKPNATTPQPVLLPVDDARFNRYHSSNQIGR